MEGEGEAYDLLSFPRSRPASIALTKIRCVPGSEDRIAGKSSAASDKEAKQYRAGSDEEAVRGESYKEDNTK